ncbi:hypothetical protein [Beijerinckia sp. L45]|uniref:hypothetical protein n=1 Tax=Beijerinckia sp. L45 TaxID=1641855 RepID=UPI00131A6A8C|nr:hypothetical protein [Beijerinckia sp. L45]
MERLDALTQAVERADLATIEALDLASLSDIVTTASATPDIAQAERQARARIGYLDRAIRSNGTAAPTNDIEKLRRRAARAAVALRDTMASGASAAAA